MASLAELERRITRLEDIEEIKKLKSDYWYYVDKKQWDKLVDLFTEDAVWKRPDGNNSVGRKALVERIKQRCDPLRTIHQGHQHKIEITSETTATGRWAMYDDLVDIHGNSGFEGWGFYEDEYVKQNGKWKIKTTSLSRLLTG